MSDVGPIVVALDEQGEIVVDLERWQRLAVAALRSCDVDRGELNLIFVAEPAMAALNEEHMGEARPTDVLSFPLDGADEAAVGPPLIGDVIVCPAYAHAQAAAHAGERGHDGSLDDELALLIVHGVLHVLGHDHAEPAEAGEMRAHEDRLLVAHHRS